MSNKIITQDDIEHIEEILNHPLEDDEDYQKLAELTDLEVETQSKKKEKE